MMNDQEKFNAIYKRESELLRRDVRSSRDRLDDLLMEDFLEFGSSGKVYKKDDILTVLAEEPDTLEWVIEDFRERVLGDELVLVTYRSRATDGKNTSTALRSSIWKNIDGSWKMCFHQGTEVEGQDSRHLGDVPRPL